MKFVTFVLAAALAASVASAQSGSIVPNENLVVEGIPPVPAAIAEAVRPYTESRSAGFASWHPTRREMLISTRFADTAQVHLVKNPGGARRQLTFFPDRVGGAAFQPARGQFFVFSKDIGGGEFFQLYRYDVPTGAVTLLTDGKSRNGGGRWTRNGERIAYTSTRRNGQDTDLYVQNPSDPKTDRRLAELSGGGWQAVDWSADAKKLLVVEGLSVNESYLWLFDAATGEKTLVTPRGPGEKVSYGSGKFVPGANAIYTTTDKDAEFQRLVRLDLTSGRQTVLTGKIPWDVEDFDVTRDGKTDGLRDRRGGRERPPGSGGRFGQGAPGSRSASRDDRGRPVAPERARPRLHLLGSAVALRRLLLRCRDGKGRALDRERDGG